MKVCHMYHSTFPPSLAHFKFNTCSFHSLYLMPYKITFLIFQISPCGLFFNTITTVRGAFYPICIQPDPIGSCFKQSIQFCMVSKL